MKRKTASVPQPFLRERLRLIPKMRVSTPIWGSLVFFGNFIPYIGSAAAVLFPVAIFLVQTQNLPRALVLVAVLMAFQIFVANVFEPRLAGRTLNLSPVLIILSLAFWAWLWGVVGLVLAVPIMVSLRLVLENVPATRPFAVLMMDRAPSPPSSGESGESGERGE